jgi:hypothetical protein
MPPLRVGKARDSLRFEYRLRDFLSTAHSRAFGMRQLPYRPGALSPRRWQLRIVALESLLLRQEGSNDRTLCASGNAGSAFAHPAQPRAVRGQSLMGHARSPGVPARLPIGERSRGNWSIVREPGFWGWLSSRRRSWPMDADDRGIGRAGRQVCAARSTRQCLIPCAGLRVIRLENRSSLRFRVDCRRHRRSTGQMMRRGERCDPLNECVRPRSSADAPSTRRGRAARPSCRARCHSGSLAPAEVPLC